MKRIVFATFCIVMLAVTGPARLDSVPADFDRSQLKRSEMKYVPGEVLVQYRATVSESYAAMHASGKNHAFVKALPRLDRRKGPMAVVRLRGKTKVEEAVKQFESDPDVEYAQPNYIYRKQAAPNDPLYGQLWGLKHTNQTVTDGTFNYYNPPGPEYSGYDIDAEEAWDVITDCSSITVAVIDSGVNYSHEDLAENMVNGSYSCPGGTGTRGCDFVGAGDNDPMDFNGHGTHVAGTIGAVGNNGKGVTGVCWKAKILAVRVLDAAGSGTTADIVEGLVFAVGTGAGQGNAKVVNMSLGGANHDQAFEDAITAAQDKDVVVVVAAGNGGADGIGDFISSVDPSYPCQYPHENIICVAAADQRNEKAWFSNYSSTYVDIAAPGANILSTYAGVKSLLSDNNVMNGWSIDTVSGTPWGMQTCEVDDNVFWPMLLLPADCAFLNAETVYSQNTNATIYKSYSLPNSVDSTYVDFILFLDTEANNDWLHGYHDSSGENPVTAGAKFFSLTGTGAMIYQAELSACNGASECSVGFNVATNATDNRTGTAIADLQLWGIDVDVTDRYQPENGTSMAAPHVAGVAAMLRARNPNYTYQDTINAITGGGTYAIGFLSMTKYGRTLNAFGALKYIPQTEGVTVNTP